MIVPLLPPIAVIAVAAAFVGMIVSIIPRISSISQQTPTPSAIEPVVGGILAIYGLCILAFLFVVFFGALGIYFMIDRRNRHFIRQQLLFSTIGRYLASKVPRSENISQLNYLTEDSVYAEQPKSAGIWALLYLFITAITALVISYSLTQDMRKHDELQSRYQALLAPSLVEAGFQEPNFKPYKSHNRDSALFIILTAITGGLFWIYWYYILLKDYNDHFAEQAKFEEQILKTLLPAQSPRACRTCGGNMPSTAKFCPNCGSKQTD